MPPCLEDNAVLELLDGTAKPADIISAEQHLDGCRDCRQLVATLASRAMPDSAAAPDDVDEDARELAWQATSGAELVRPGSRIGRYTILEPIGSGASSVVYAAFDPKLDRRIALKLLRVLTVTDASGSATTTAQRARARLLREAKALARVNHPNVVSVHDANVHGDFVYVAMEYVEGQSLRQWLETTTASLNDKAMLLVQAARGLAAAHEVGLVHRDFKPANVMVGDDELVRVTDFGLARMGDDSPEPSTQIRQTNPTSIFTETGAQVGTPAYMAPEVRHGGTATAQSDQYSFAVTLFETLTGARPSEPERSVESSALAKRFKRVIARALSDDPSDRFESMGVLVRALERPSSKRPRRRYGLVAGGVIALAAAAAAVFIATSKRGIDCDGEPAMWQTVWNRDRAELLKREHAGDKRNHVETTLAKIISTLSTRGDHWVGARRSVCSSTHDSGNQSEALLDIRMSCLATNLRDTDAAVAVLLDNANPESLDGALSVLGRLADPTDCENTSSRVKPLPNQPELREAIEAVRDRISQARALHGANQLDKAKEATEGLLDAARQTSRDEIVADALTMEATMSAAHGNHKRAEELLIEAATRAAHAGDDELLASVHILLIGVVGVSQRRLEEGLVWAKAAETDMAALEATNHALVADRLRELGDAYLFAGKFDRGIDLVEQALEAETKARTREHIEVAGHLSRLGAAERQRGKYDAAAERLNEALTILERVVGADHPEMARPTANLSGVKRLLGDYEESAVLGERALALLESAYGKEHPDVATALALLGHTKLRLERFDEGREDYRRAMKIRAKHGDDPDDRARLLGYLANADILEGKHADAVALYRQVLKSRLTKLKPDHPSIGSIRFNLATALVGAGRIDEGHSELVLAQQITQKAFGPDNWKAVQPLTSLGEIERRRGRCDKAIPHYRRVIGVYEKTFGKDNPRLIPAVVALGICLAEGKKHREAVELFERGIKLRLSKRPEGSALVVFRVHLAVSLFALGEKQRAKDAADLAIEGLEGRAAGEPILGITSPMPEAEADKVIKRVRALQRQL